MSTALQGGLTNAPGMQNIKEQEMFAGRQMVREQTRFPVRCVGNAGRRDLGGISRAWLLQSDGLLPSLIFSRLRLCRGYLLTELLQ